MTLATTSSGLVAPKHRRFLSAMLVGVLLLSPNLWGQIAFTWLEGMTGATHVTLDGSIVIGAGGAESWNAQPARWTTSGGVYVIGLIPGVVDPLGGWVSDMSVDGSVVVGTMQSGVGASGYREQAFRWTEKTGTVGLGTLPDRASSEAVAVSGDGSVVVGQSESSLPGGERHVLPKAFRYTVATGMKELVPGSWSAVTDITVNGELIIGGDEFGPFRWTESTGRTPLIAGVRAMSADGNYLVGGGYGPTEVPFRWSEATGRVPLENLPIANGQGGFANAVSMDGNFILGESFNQHLRSFPFIWTPTSGARGLLDVFENVYGLDDELAGWTRLSVGGMSDDGRFLVGSAFDPTKDYQAWLLDLGSDPPIIPRGDQTALPAIPEPGTYGLLGAALLMAMVILRRRGALRRDRSNLVSG